MSGMNVPEGWLKVSLGDVVNYGQTQKCELKDVSLDTWVLELEDIEKDSSQILQKLDAKGRPFKSTKNIFKKGDVLYGKLRPYLNKVVIADNEGVCSTEILPLNAEPNADNRFLLYWLKGEVFLNYVNEVSYGVNMPRLGTKDGVAAPFLLAPLAEQKVIAAKLDSLLAQVDSTKARLERIPTILKRFRQSVLAAAVSGRLTEEWRSNNEYAQNGYPKDWIEFGFSEVGDLARGKSKHRPRNDQRLFGKEYPFIQTGEVANSNGLITTATKYYSEFGLAQSKLFPKGTLCITIAANIADTAILGIDACFPDSVVGFTPDISKCEVLFVKYLVDVNKENLEDFAPATAQKNINLKILNEMRIPFPSIEEQTEIVRRVEELFAFADSIEEKALAALERVGNLTQSILAKAFRGDLTAAWRAANPELISGDNSAEALLAKIKEERELLKKQPKPKRTGVKKKTGKSMSKEVIKVVEALKQAGKPLNGQQLLAVAGYPSDSSTEQLEQFFLDLRDALALDKSIVKLKRDDDGQDWFAIAEATHK